MENNNNEMIQSIIQKSKMVMTNCQIRHTSDVNSYTIFNLNGKLMVGISVTDFGKSTLGPLFPGKNEWEMSNSKGEIVAKHVQFLNQ
jgi:hypothetical protein